MDPDDIKQITRALEQSHREQDDARGIRDKNEERFERRTRYLGWVIGGIVAVTVWLWTIKLTVDSLHDWQKDVQKPVNDMIYMKDHGISNKEQYQKDNGQPAPNFQ